MALFKNRILSHEHSLEVLNLLYGYDSFLDSIRTVADVGCGTGLDAEWWATLMTRDDPPEPRNYKVFAVDRDIKQLDPEILARCPNIIPLEKDFTTRTVSTQVDLIWCHDTFQFSRNPMSTLAGFRRMLNQDGMMILTIPQTTYIKDNKLVIESHTGQYYSYNTLNLMYLLASSGFDCRDAYFYRKENTPWLYAAVYASPHEPIGENATWYELAEKNLVSDSLINSVNRHGFARLEDLIVTWLDKNYYQIKD